MGSQSRCSRSARRLRSAGTVVALGSAVAAVAAVAAVGITTTATAARTAPAAPAAPSAPATPAAKADAMAAMGHAVPASAAGNLYPEVAHTRFNPELPPVASGSTVSVHLKLKDVTVEIAPGVKYLAWGFEGGVPGPVIHVRQGTKVKLTLTNGGMIPHSVDFHAARIAPNKAFVDVMPGKSITYTFTAGDPGVFMYHCGTKPVLAHIANGMYGAIVVDPLKPLPHADRQYVLVAGEWYLNGDGKTTPASIDMGKARQMQPDYVTWNGFAGQYVKEPLVANPGETVRFWVVDAGPSLDTAFHVVGTIINRAWVDADMSQYLHGVQTVNVPAGGGGVFDVKIDEPGLYPVLSHSFASVDLGQVGLLNVGGAKGTMSH